VCLEGNGLLIGIEEQSKAELDLIKFERIALVGAGKATAPMARAIEEL
jgi:glycerate-2-kinase